MNGRVSSALCFFNYRQVSRLCKHENNGGSQNRGYCDEGKNCAWIISHADRLWSCVTNYRAFITGCKHPSAFSRPVMWNPASAAQPQSCKMIWSPRLAPVVPITIDESSKRRTLWPHHNSLRRHPSWFSNRVRSLKLAKTFYKLSGVIPFRHSASRAWFRPRTQANACWHNPNGSHTTEELSVSTTNNPTTNSSINPWNRRPTCLRL